MCHVPSGLGSRGSDCDIPAHRVSCERPVFMARRGGTAPGTARPHYAWTILGVAFITFLAAAGIRSAPSVFIVPLEQEFGWSRATISFAIGMQLLVYGLIGPFSAGLADRYGMRKVLLGAIALTALSFAATSIVTTPLELTLIWGIGSGLGTGCAALVLASVIANRWFVARRGIAVGVMTGSVAMGQLMFLPTIADLIAAVGWRTAVLVAAAAASLALPALWFFMVDRPSDVGVTRYGQPADAPDEAPASPVNPFTATLAIFGEVIGSRDFWILSASFFVCGASTFGLISTHFIPACLDHGIPETTAAGLLAVMGVCNVVGSVASGWLTDRFDSRYLLFWYYAVRGVALFLIPYAFDLPIWSLGAFGVFYGFDWITTVPPTIRLTTSLFGARRAGIVYGWIMVAHQLGAAIFAYAGGVVRTEFGTYTSAFLVSAAICVAAAMLVLRIGRTSLPSPRPALAEA
jgi:sugar phosphate permease